MARPLGQPRQLLTGLRYATVSGFSLHANVAIPAADRPRLERICRYAARPPLAIERLSERLDGWLAYRLKRPWLNVYASYCTSSLLWISSVICFARVRAQRVLASGTPAAGSYRYWFLSL